MKISNFKFFANRLTHLGQISKIITFIIILLLMVGVSLFAFWRYNKAKEAMITLGAPKTVQVDQEFEIPVKIDTAGKNINAAEIYLEFDPSQLEVISVSKDNSFFTLWITDEPKFSNDRGDISFAGGLPSPGFTGIGQIGGIRIKAKKTGKITIEFDKKSRVLLNDGFGTKIKLKLDSVSIKSGE